MIMIMIVIMITIIIIIIIIIIIVILKTPFREGMGNVQREAGVRNVSSSLK